MGLEATASLLVAALDLQVVRLLRDAIRTADLSSRAGAAGQGAAGPLGTVPQAASFEGRPNIDPTPRILPRPVIHPTPHFEPRPVVHPSPRDCPAPPPPPACDAEPVCPAKCNNPIQPPWKMPVHEIPLPPPLKVKLVVHRTDLIHKGSLLDLFI